MALYFRTEGSSSVLDRKGALRFTAATVLLVCVSAATALRADTVWRKQMRLLPLACFALVLSAAAFAADAPASPASKILDGQLTSVEKQFVPLVEAMPADKFSFAPTSGEFKGVRTFSKQASHVAAVIVLVSAAILGEKPPLDPGPDENGPASLKTKDDVVKYVKDSFAYSHRAMASLTNQNVFQQVPGPFGSPASKLSLANIAVSHSFDHYGQMVVYLRMNGIIPPASRR
jgi:hypothetical protein